MDAWSGIDPYPEDREPEREAPIMSEADLQTIIYAAREYEQGRRFHVPVEVEAMAFAKAVVQLANERKGLEP